MPLCTDYSLPWHDTYEQVVYKRYASLYFVMGIDVGDNELITLELIHHYVEVLDRYFGNVCELDLIFNFHKVWVFLEDAPSLLSHLLRRPLCCAVWASGRGRDCTVLLKCRMKHLRAA